MQKAKVKKPLREHFSLCNTSRGQKRKWVYFKNKSILLATRLLEPPSLLIFGEIPNYKITLSRFKLLFSCSKAL